MDWRYVGLLSDQRRGDAKEVAKRITARRNPVRPRGAYQGIVGLRLFEQLLFVEVGTQSLVVHGADLSDADEPAPDHQVAHTVGLLVHDEPLDRAQALAVLADHRLTGAQLSHVPSSVPPASGLTSMRLRASSRRCSQILR